ncbi:copper amine oxidase N-terminal domain-containing protein [Paenibacillus sp. sptzw28]|uniref:stalk domain-containing protein n=1 Tax=Paenibacillus sp. sptzw28 TaxID=715179 RepID=UPI001C6E3C93|nr:stalk domain-containing protein [Paenibacillus sp. sptzw28]QYR20033.1 copper amine oxidase N-terminal domain-containing protein [Paenibacillus sp. sptzw28]
MKSLKWLLILSLLVVSFANVSQQAIAAGGTSDQLVMQLKSSVMIHNGVTWKSAQPLTLEKGTTFVALSSIAARYGYNLTYDAKTKESVAVGKSHELHFKIGSTTVYGDGKPVKASAAPYILKGSLMVPLRVWAQLTESTFTVAGAKMTLSWNVVKLPTANFEVQPTEIYAGDTTVTYIDRAFNPSGQPFVEDRWEGKMDVFPEAGTYTITRQVQDTNGQWSAPYSVVIEVKPQNQPPVADFSTEKVQYRIGEKVIYTDLSTDDENAIVRSTWKGNDDVFFEPGEKSITLEVQDKHGLTSSITKTITVTNEVLYTRDEYNKLFTAVGDKFAVDGSSVLQIPLLPYTIQSESAQMVRSNSPEILLGEGIAYQAQLTGQVRFMFHNQNEAGYPVKIYLIATNNNSEPVTVSTSSTGIGGPDPYVVNSAKMSAIRYMQSLADDPSPTSVTIRPHQTVKLLPEISKVPLKQMDVFTAYADLYSDQELQYQVVVVAAPKDPIAALPSLSVLERNDVHVRGTFNKANRVIEMDDTLGDKAGRILIGDNKIDRYIDGIDETSGELELNVGNFGVLYKMKLTHVAPHTLIALNPRGGLYTGAFLVNGQVVPATNTSVLKNSNDAVVLYRTGDSEESVEIVFTNAAGSNLPVTMLFMPLPPLRY